MYCTSRAGGLKGGLQHSGTLTASDPVAGITYALCIAFQKPLQLHFHYVLAILFFFFFFPCSRRYYGIIVTCCFQTSYLR